VSRRTEPAGHASVRVSRLANGLRVVTDSMTSVESVTLGIWAGVGARDEPASLNGVAHLLEHMAFKGTTTRSARDIAEAIEAVGGHLNAHTARDHTAYYAKVLKEDVALALDILADILRNPVFEPKELDCEKAVILQEIGQSLDTPDDIVFDRFQEVAYPEQALGRPVLGTAETVGRMQAEQVADYLGKHYRADRMVLVGAGNLDHERFVELAEPLFGPLPGGGGAGSEPARYAGGEARESRELEQVHLVLGFEGLAYEDPDFYAAAVLSTLLGGGMSSRLFQEIREKRGLVYSIYSYTSSYVDGGIFAVYAGTGEHQVAELIPRICDEIAGIGNGVETKEIARARAQIKAGIRMALENTGARAERLASHLLFRRRIVPVGELLAAIDAVDGEALRRVARRLVKGTPTFAALGPVDKIETFDSIRARFL
jgi:predicted Zn-dependent peptidase